ncbi:MAG: prepilin peptidase [Lactobacillaceae bacterium]|jgi:leader peptidase (prepilin peptidase)/N-methyltransferase|nr:prepilin peptidase [Lactobacillaceae bacterium]
MFIFLFFLGSSLASFTICIAYRINHNIPLNGFSVCDACEETINPIYLLPFFGWFLAFGKCKKCFSKIPFKYCFYELFLGIFFIFISDWKILLVGLCLLFLAEEDTFNLESSSWICLPLIFLFYGNFKELNTALLISLFIFLYATTVLFEKMGVGDIPVIVLIFVVFNEIQFIYFLFLLSIIMLLAFMYTKNHRLPMIPFLLITFIFVHVVCLF